MISGSYFQSKIRSIAEKVTRVEFLDTLPDLSSYTLNTNKWDVSVAENRKIMAWFEGTTLRIGANGPVIANPDCSWMFRFGYNKNNIESISFDNNFDTSDVTNMSYMFTDCRNLTSMDVSQFDTSKVTDMSHMFQYCALTGIDVSKFDTSNVVNMEYMFTDCRNLTSLDVSNFDTSNVTEMNSMFRYCNSLTKLDLRNFDTSKITDMEYMFEDCKSLTSLDVSKFNTSKVTTMYFMFYNCRSLTSLDLNSFDTSKVTNMYDMFYNCNKLTATMTLRGNPTSYYDMFRQTSTEAGAKFTLNYTSSTASIVDKLIATKSSNSNVVKGNQVN